MQTPSRKSLKIFTVGLLFPILTLVFYCSYLSWVARPGFIGAKEKHTFSRDQKKKIVHALVELSQIADLIGLDQYSALFGGSAAVIGSQIGESFADNSYLLFRAAELTKLYGTKTGNYDPYLETNFNTAFFFKDQGDIKQAKKIVADSLQFASKNAHTSYWVANFNGLNKYLNTLPD